MLIYFDKFLYAYRKPTIRYFLLTEYQYCRYSNRESYAHVCVSLSATWTNILQIHGGLSNIFKWL